MKRSETCALDLCSGSEICWQGTATRAPGEKSARGASSETAVHSKETRGKAKPSEVEKSQERESDSGGVVRLLQATKIPAGYRKMVKAKVEGSSGKHVSLFTSSQDSQCQKER